MPITRAYGQASQLGNTPAASNPIINGGFDIWQRGTSFANPTSNAYVADRFQQSVPTNTTISRQATGDTTNLANIQYNIRVQRNNGATTTGTLYLGQASEIENCVPFAGKTITFSFYARKGANYSSASDALTLRFFTGNTATQQNGFTGTYTGSVSVMNETFTLTTTWQRFTKTVTLNSDITQFSYWFQHTTVGTAGAADYYDLTGVQIDIGSVALPFRRTGGTLAGELAACQRYYCKTYNIDVAPGTSTENGIYYFSQGTDSQGTALATIDFPVVMRTAPTVTTYTGSGTSGNWKYARSGVSPTDTATTVDPIGTRQARVYGATGGNYVVCTFSGHFVASAEL